MLGGGAKKSVMVLLVTVRERRSHGQGRRAKTTVRQVRDKYMHVPKNVVIKRKNILMQ